MMLHVEGVRGRCCGSEEASCGSDDELEPIRRLIAVILTFRGFFSLQG